MATPPLTVNRPSKGLSRKLRNIGRLRRRSNEIMKEEYEIIHTPDRPTRLITPIEAPTEEECGKEIARWQRALAKGRNYCSETDCYGRTEMDRTAGVVRSKDIGGYGQRQHAIRPLLGSEMGRGGNCQNVIAQRSRPLGPSSQREAGAAGTEIMTQQTSQLAPMSSRSVFRTNHAGATISPTPAPLFFSTAQSLPSTSEPPSISQTPAAVLGEKFNPGPRYTGVRMEIYHRGFCPFCRRMFDHDSLPLNCPYIGCKADLRLCRKCPNRSDAPRAPPRLAQRGFLDTTSVSNDGVVVGEASRELSRWRSIPQLTVEAPTPTDEQRQPARPRAASPSPPGSRPRTQSPSPPSTSRMIRPSSLGDNEADEIKPPSSTPKRFVDLEKPLPSPLTPPSRPERRGNPASPPSARQQPTALSSSIAERHQQLYKQRHYQPHIASQMRTPLPSPSSTAICASFPPPVSLSSISSTASSNNGSNNNNHTSTTTTTTHPQATKQKGPSPAPSPSPPNRGSTAASMSLRAPRRQQQKDGRQDHHQPQEAAAPRQILSRMERRRGTHVSGNLKGLDLPKRKEPGKHARPETKECDDGGAENAELIMEIVKIYQEEEEEEERKRRADIWMGKGGNGGIGGGSELACCDETPSRSFHSV
ncbi:hypothetical protein L209DRAFT_77370 [Thermothelomyces heterothallicus CBS 203.75]